MLTYQKLIIQEDFQKEPNSPMRNQIKVINFRPNQMESLQINDRETHLYRDYDTKGRISQNFHQKAALAGIKNLETISFRKDSPVKQT